MLKKGKHIMSAHARNGRSRRRTATVSVNTVLLNGIFAVAAVVMLICACTLLPSEAVAQESAALSAPSAESAHTETTENANANNSADSTLTQNNAASSLLASGGTQCLTGKTGESAYAFEREGGTYTLDYVLKHYSVLVAGDLTGDWSSHIVGPVIIGGLYAAKNGVIGNVSHTVPSFIGKIYAEENGTVTRTLNDFNVDDSHNVYLGCETLSKLTLESWRSVDYLFGGGANQHNRPHTLYTNQFFDFTKMEALAEQARTLNANSRALRVDDFAHLPEGLTLETVGGMTSLVVPAGTTVLMSGEDLGKYPIVIDAGETNDAVNLSGMAGTIIATDDSGSVTVPGFRATKVRRNGSTEYVTPTDAQSSTGISLVFSLPNATNVATAGSSYGHIVAPSAQVKLQGGSHNGSVVAQSLDSGSEIRLWPYSGDFVVPPTEPETPETPTTPTTPTTPETPDQPKTPDEPDQPTTPTTPTTPTDDTDDAQVRLPDAGGPGLNVLIPVTGISLIVIALTVFMVMLRRDAQTV